MSDIRNYMKKRMTVLENTDEDIREYEKRIKVHKNRKIKIIIIIVAIIAVAIVTYLLYQNFRTFENYEVVSTQEMSEAYNSTFIEYNEGFVKYNADGIEYIVDGTTVWQQAFEMKNPIIDICKDYVAIAEYHSNKVYIFSLEGLKGEVETSYPIISLEVAAQGVVALITEQEDTNHIEVLNKNGDQIAMGQTILSGDGCPVDLSISEDGTKLMVSYLYLSGGVMQSRVAFYNYGDVGKNEVDRLVGGFNHYESTIVGKVEFINNDVAVAFGDDIITIYSVMEKPELIKDIQVDKQIKNIAYDEKYIAYVVETGEGDKEYEMYVYDEDAKLQTTEKFNFDCTSIKIRDGIIILYNNNQINIFTAKGVNKFRGTINEGINEVLTSIDKYVYRIVSGERIYNIKLN